MDEYISRQAAIEALGEAPEVWTGSNIETSTLFQWELDRAAIDAVPTADVVSRNCYDAILWENDIMRKQLAEIGKTLGAKMDDVRPVVRGKWIRGEEGTFGNPYGHYDCSECGERFAYRRVEGWHRENFCPNCGADMGE